MDSYIVFLQLSLTFIFALLFGIERQRSHKPVGFGTFIFVAIGACALAITATNLNSENPLPLLSAIVSGIGFLGAGALLRPSSDKIFGATTAAGIWVFAIIGILIGVNEYGLAISVYVLVWVTIIADRYLASRGIGFYQKKLTITTGKLMDPNDVDCELLDCSKNHKLLVTDVDKKGDRITLTFIIEGTSEDIRKVTGKLAACEWVAAFHVE
ncbi:MgtC family protein [uncultured archaeon]|nr:MgtC family protein [uncultured archaeon]